MGNGFVEYLNTLNNASSGNENAISESQVTNPYYQKIYIEREIGTYLSKKIKDEAVAVILTGHAGDGKTGLVYQMLKTNNLIQDNHMLNEYDEVQFKDSDKTVTYVKDMSELDSDEQYNLLKKTLETVKNGNSSILVSNTGPLINAFIRMSENDLKETADEIEEIILRYLDRSDIEEQNIGDYKVIFVNVAQIDNVDFSAKFIEKIIAEDLWAECENCERINLCSIYNNVLSIRENEKNVKKFIEGLYRWLYLNDRRLTIRQMIAQLSYSLTGNLSCSNDFDNESKLFDYHFANLFFGFIGTMPSKNAFQIRGVREVNSLNLDSKKLIGDYQHFVRGDFSDLTPRTFQIMKKAWDKKIKTFFINSADIAIDLEAHQLRKSARRMELLFSMNEKSVSENFDNAISPLFSRYLQIRNNGLDRKSRNFLMAIVLKALYAVFVGTVENNEIKSIYLPFQRKGVGKQHVQLLYGEIPVTSIRIEDQKVIASYDKNKFYYEIALRFDRLKDPIILSFPMLEYFEKVSKGSVSTKVNPSLSHGIERIKSVLFKKYRFLDEEIIRILVHTLKEPKVIKFEIDNDDTLYIHQ